MKIVNTMQGALDPVSIVIATTYEKMGIVKEGCHG